MLLAIEQQYWPTYPHIAGVDEAGRGAWAGPVVAAAVIFDQDVVIPGVDDSKKLTPPKREKLFTEITKKCLSYGVGMVESDEIDRINILEATKKAMLMAVAQLSPQPDFLFIDGNAGIDSSIPQKAIIDGDALSHSIAAASIIAKVTRDRLMVELSCQFPFYGFEKHKGYGTKVHLTALREHGVLSIHRKSYRPVIQLFDDNR
jgi:ribonuclease HII